ncbi:hypothetical protein Tco_0426358 [Tanacetum coccineum]
MFNELDDDEIDNMDTEDAQDVGRTRNGVNAEKEGTEEAVSIEDVVSIDKEKVSTDRSKDSTDKEEEARSATSTTPTTTPIMFGDDETIAHVLLNMIQAKVVSREKEKRIMSIRNLKTLLQEDRETEEERKRLADEEATKTALSDEYDFIQAKIEADRLLALRLQDEEREQFTVKQRAKFLRDTIAAQRRFIAEQIAIAIRNKPPTRTQLRNQMMTYLKHVGNKKHSDLKSKTFEEIQALYEKVKGFDESLTAVGSTEDERRIKEMNEGVKDTDQKRLKEEDIEKVLAKVEVTEQGSKKRKGGHIKMIARKKPRKQSDDDSDDEHRKCLKTVTFKGTLDSEIMEKKSIIARLDKISSPDGDYLVLYRANRNFRAFNYLMEVLHTFDRQDLFHLYELMMEQYSEITLEGFELIL